MDVQRYINRPMLYLSLTVIWEIPLREIFKVEHFSSIPSSLIGHFINWLKESQSLHLIQFLTAKETQFFFSSEKMYASNYNLKWLHTEYLSPPNIFNSNYIVNDTLTVLYL